MGIKIDGINSNLVSTLNKVPNLNQKLAAHCDLKMMLIKWLNWYIGKYNIIYIDSQYKSDVFPTCIRQYVCESLAKHSTDSFTLQSIDGVQFSRNKHSMGKDPGKTQLLPSRESNSVLISTNCA